MLSPSAENDNNFMCPTIFFSLSFLQLSLTLMHRYISGKIKMIKNPFGCFLLINVISVHINQYLYSFKKEVPQLINFFCTMPSLVYIDNTNISSHIVYEVSKTFLQQNIYYFVNLLNFHLKYLACTCVRLYVLLHSCSKNSHQITHKYTILLDFQHSEHILQLHKL